jgi:hypothetical protein
MSSPVFPSNKKEEPRRTDREFRTSFDRQASAILSFSFACLFPPEARKTVFYFVSFHRGAMQAWIFFLVSMERGTMMRSYNRSLVG